MWFPPRQVNNSPVNHRSYQMHQVFFICSNLFIGAYMTLCSVYEYQDFVTYNARNGDLSTAFYKEFLAFHQRLLSVFNGLL